MAEAHRGWWGAGRWTVAVTAALAVFFVLWWAWFVFGWPPAGANRLAVALPVAAVVSAALSGPLFTWAGRERPTIPRPGGQVAPVPGGPADAVVVVGEIPREPAVFVDRDTVGRLAAAAGSGRPAVLCAVTGLRGVGKTQVAAAYARRCVAEGWELVGWVNAESRDVMLAGLARVAAAAGVADPQGDSEELARRLREHLQTRPGSGLLVFDNAADPDGLRPFLPAAGGTRVVVTSTDRAFAEMGVPVDVSAFTRAESVGYLVARTGLDDDVGADAVAAELGDLPLGLAQAATAINRRHLSYLAYLDQLARMPAEKLLGQTRSRVLTIDDQRRLKQELCRVFTTREALDDLFAASGLFGPMPADVETVEQAWTTVVGWCTDRPPEDGFGPLLALVRVKYPYNPVFREFAEF